MEKTIQDLAIVLGGGTPDTTNKSYWNGHIQWFTPSEIGKTKYVNSSLRTITEEGLNNSAAKLLPPHTILLSSRATVGECSLTLQECATNQGFQSLIAKNIYTDFLYYLIQTKKKELIKKSCGSTFLEISANEVRKIRVAVPTKDEQLKISQLLSLIDERIATQNKIIDNLQSLIKGLIQRLSQEGFANGSWHRIMLSEILTERNELNAAYHPVHSVSVSAGVVNQVEYLGRSFAAKDTAHYHVVYNGDIVYTKSPTGNQPFGIVKQSHCLTPAAVSPLYGVYQPCSFEIGNYLHYYFLNPLNTNNYLSPLIQKGAKNTINISNQRFLENRVPLPIDKMEIQLVSDSLSALDKKINLEYDVLTTLEHQKKFLLNNMFI
ncbi:MAG: restriction endonuclease subunit S [Odoribacter sp.]|nr:restriction endonuclease subunit S [Odoribacter sp.]